MTKFRWICPFCNHSATISDDDYHVDRTTLTIDNIMGPQILISEFVVCPNPDCRKYNLSISLWKAKYNISSDQYPQDKYTRYKYTQDKLLRKWNLIPPSEAKTFPNYIPKAIIDDYKEACLIRDLSSKASATLSRRCLQTMIRDFWKVKGKRNLKEEIEAIKDIIDPLTWKAIGAVRNIGNIGAHMEEDINLIVDVEPNEAKLLIELIETLIKEWYVNKHEREERLKKIVQVSDKKDIKKSTQLKNRNKN